MPSSVTNHQTERCIRSLLEMKGYELSEPLPPGGLGCDIIANKGTILIAKNKPDHITVDQI